jgi:PAS domain S-box-containing protein
VEFVEVPEHGLQDRLKCLLTAVDLAPVGIVQLTLDGRILRSNPSFAAMVAHPAERLTGERFADYVAKEDRVAMQAGLSKAITESASGLQREVRLQCAGGETVWSRVSLSLVSDSSGCPADVVAVAEDISGQKQLEAALIRASHEFEVFADSVPGIVFLINADGKFLRWNRYYRELLGYTDQEMAEVEALETIAPEDRDYIARKMDETVSAGKSEAEFHAVTKNGRRIPLLASAVNLGTEGGSPRIAGLGIDVSVRRETQEALHRSQSRLRALLDATDEVALLMKPDGTLLEVNEAVAVAVEAPGRKLAGQNLFDMMEPSEAASRRPKLDEVLESGKPVRFEDTNVDGVVREITAYPVRSREGEVDAIAVFSRDVTEQRRLEERQRALSAHQVAVREDERTRIAHEIHDELGQQLTVMKFDVARLKSQLRSLPVEAQLEFRKQVDSLDGFLDVAVQTVRRISTDLRPSVLDHFGLVAALENQASDFERRTGIRCRCKFPKEIKLAGDLSTTIFRICQEALTNVARHSGAKDVEIAMEQDGPDITFRVEDNGCGASEAALNASGSLGLLSMMERARMANGTARIEGRQGRGTRVVARFATGGATPDPASG